MVKRREQGGQELDDLRMLLASMRCQRPLLLFRIAAGIMGLWVSVTQKKKFHSTNPHGVSRLKEQ